jgi:hypothetical protein
MIKYDFNPPPELVYELCYVVLVLLAECYQVEDGANWCGPYSY